MKSYIKDLADYRKAPFERNVTIRCPEDYVQKQIRHLTRNHKKTKAVQTIENGDIVVLSMESELPKFNRPMVPVTVGGNLFDTEFETQLPGHGVGETFTITVQEKPVSVTVKQADRIIFPQATDEMAEEYAAANEEFSEVRTVEEFKNRVIEKYLEEEKQKALFDAMDEVLSYVFTHSDWEFDEDEILEQIKGAHEGLRQSLEEEGKTPEALTEEELQVHYGVNSLEELDNMIRINAEQYIASQLFLLAVHQKNSVEEIDGYPWDFLQEFVEKNLNVTEER